MSYTLKLDWDDRRIEVTRRALRTLVALTPLSAEDKQAAEDALDDIDLYRGAVEDAKAIIAQDAYRATRLEYLRGEIRAERISSGEIAELQSLAEYIETGDTELLQWAGVPEERES